MYSGLAGREHRCHQAQPNWGCACEIFVRDIFCLQLVSWAYRISRLSPSCHQPAALSSENVGLLEIERIFEAKVKPETLAMKASRMQGVTNVTPESKVIETITETPKILENRHPQGGGQEKTAS